MARRLVPWLIVVALLTVLVGLRLTDSKERRHRQPPRAETAETAGTSEPESF